MSSKFRIAVATLATALLALPIATGGYRAEAQEPAPDDASETAGESETAAMSDQMTSGSENALPFGPAIVVIALNPSTAGNSAGAIANVQVDVLDTLPPGSVTDVHRFENIPALVGVVDDTATIKALAANPQVARVDIDVGGRALLGEVLPVVGADVAQANGFTGAGATVAVIDSGVQSDHPDLASSVVLTQACFGETGTGPTTGYCPDGSGQQIGFSTDVPPPAEDIGGHGTHVAGTITSDGIVASIGVAPDADIVAIKSLNENEAFFSFTLNIVAALDYLISHPELGVDIVNMSLGTFTEFAGDCDNDFAFTMAGKAAVDQLNAQGVTVLAASGGTGNDTMPAPACLSNVIAVGATDDADNVAGFSNSNNTTDIFAPGVDVLSTEPLSTTGTRSGTSMASAVASGCAALLVQAGEGNTPAELEARLKASPTMVTDSRGLTFPRVHCAIATPTRLLTVEKQVVGATPGSDWEFTLTAAVGCFTDDLDATSIVITVAAAGGAASPVPITDGCEVTVTETAVAGYTTTPDLTQTVTLGAAETVTFTNTQDPTDATITIAKTVIGDDTITSDFTITAATNCTATPTTTSITGTGTATITVTDITTGTAQPCTYTIEETTLTGYTLTPAGPQVANPGDTIEFTNTQDPTDATITIAKTVIGDDNITSDFTITAATNCTATPTTTSITGTGTATITVTDITTGTAQPCTYTIEETTLTGYTLTPAGPQVANPGDTIEFTNTQDPTDATITIAKTVIGDDNITSDFTITAATNCTATPTTTSITGTGTATITVTDITTGTAQPCTYTIEETTLTGYTLTPAGPQVANPGDTIEFTNTQDPTDATITIAKTVIGDDNITSDFTITAATNCTATPTTTSITGTGTATITVTDITTGTAQPCTYTVTASAIAGYTLAPGEPQVANPGETVGFTYTRIDSAPTPTPDPTAPPITAPPLPAPDPFTITPAVAPAALGFGGPNVAVALNPDGSLGAGGSVPPQIALTGTEAMPIVTMAMSLVIVGGLLVVLGRRRDGRESSDDLGPRYLGR